MLWTPDEDHVVQPLTNTFVCGNPDHDCTELLAQSAPNPEVPLTLEHIADTAAFLLSPSSGGMNGRLLVMDQGLHTIGVPGGECPSRFCPSSIALIPCLTMWSVTSCGYGMRGCYHYCLVPMLSTADCVTVWSCHRG